MKVWPSRLRLEILYFHSKKHCAKDRYLKLIQEVYFFSLKKVKTTTFTQIYQKSKMISSQEFWSFWSVASDRANITTDFFNFNINLKETKCSV